jgi:FAD/FMN-containing dehydrogenase
MNREAKGGRVSGSIGIAKARIDWGQASLIALIPVAKHIKDKFDPAGDS